jgi:hypothetical protein
MPDITWSTPFFCISLSKRYAHPSDNYDADEKNRIWLLISNEQHKGTFMRTQDVKILLERLRR